MANIRYLKNVSGGELTLGSETLPNSASLVAVRTVSGVCDDNAKDLHKALIESDVELYDESQVLISDTSSREFYQDLHVCLNTKGKGSVDYRLDEIEDNAPVASNSNNSTEMDGVYVTPQGWGARFSYNLSQPQTVDASWTFNAPPSFVAPPYMEQGVMLKHQGTSNTYSFLGAIGDGSPHLAGNFFVMRNSGSYSENEQDNNRWMRPDGIRAMIEYELRNTHGLIV